MHSGEGNSNVHLVEVDLEDFRIGMHFGDMEEPADQRGIQESKVEFHLAEMSRLLEHGCDNLE